MRMENHHLRGRVDRACSVPGRRVILVLRKGEVSCSLLGATLHGQRNLRQPQRRLPTLISGGWLAHYIGPLRGCLALGSRLFTATGMDSTD